MVGDGPLSIAVVCEAPVDQQTACELADRVLSAEVDWIEPEALNDYRSWCGVEQGQSFVAWCKVPELAKGRGIRAHGLFRNEPGEPDAHSARLALLLVNSIERRPRAVLLIRDSDNDLRRREGLKQARDADRWGFAVVIGLAHTKRECWVLAGFDPADEGERRRLERVRRDLGFNPCDHAEELTAKAEGAKRDAKRVLEALTNRDLDRQRACWRDAEVSVLESRGADTGLSTYLSELRERLVPLFTR